MDLPVSPWPQGPRPHHRPPLEPRVSCTECPAGLAAGSQLVRQDSTYLVAWSLWVSMCFCPLTDENITGRAPWVSHLPWSLPC